MHGINKKYHREDGQHLPLYFAMGATKIDCLILATTPTHLLDLLTLHFTEKLTLQMNWTSALPVLRAPIWWAPGIVASSALENRGVAACLQHSLEPLIWSTSKSSLHSLGPSGIHPPSVKSIRWTIHIELGKYIRTDWHSLLYSYTVDIIVDK